MKTDKETDFNPAKTTFSFSAYLGNLGAKIIVLVFFCWISKICWNFGLVPVFDLPEVNLAQMISIKFLLYYLLNKD